MSNVNENKNKVQKEGLTAWRLNGYSGTLEMATGTGKSRCGVLAAKRFVENNPDAKILVLTPTRTIRDNAWKDEFKKWGQKKLFDKNVETECIQSAYKRSGEHFDLVIADEIHNYIIHDGTEKYSYYQFFENNTWNGLLGLSATIDDQQRVNLNAVAPVVYTINTSKALELGLISPFVIYNVPVELTAAEQKKYSGYDKQFEATFPIFQYDISILYRSMKDKDFYENLAKFHGYDYNDKFIRDAPFICHKAISGRKKLLSECEGKLKAVVKINKALRSSTGIVFGNTVDFADKVAGIIGDTCVVFHSKIGKKAKEAALKKLQDGRTKVNLIATAKALNEGANIKRLTYGIVAAGTSKERDLVQRVGRAVRFEEGKQATIIQLYVPGTQDEKWLRKRQESFKVEWLSGVDELVNQLEK